MHIQAIFHVYEQAENMFFSIINGSKILTHFPAKAVFKSLNPPSNM